ncbi:pyruvate, phosphate dikinase, chloroplastic isoform X1, partial [Tanacetum coccineum]
YEFPHLKLVLTDVLREVLIMKMLNHPNIVNLLEVIDDLDADHFYMDTNGHCPFGLTYHGKAADTWAGEDVVAGIRTPQDIVTMKNCMPEAYKELIENYEILERHYKDIMDIEFTVQENRIWMLQCRSGKHTKRLLQFLVFSILLLLLRDSSNFKTRIQAAAALAVPPSILGSSLLFNFD